MRLSDVVREVKLGQEKARGADGKINRLYRVTLEFEDAKVLKEKLNISFKTLTRVFSEAFVPRLMHETLQLIKKTAQSETRRKATGWRGVE